MVNEHYQKNDYRSKKIESAIFGLLWLYFGVKALYFTFNIKEKVFPDESSWFGISEIFSRSILPPVDSPESYPFGLITHIPNLYFYVMGKLLAINVLPVDDLIFLRTINALSGMLTIWISWKLVRMFSQNTAVRLLFIVMLTNTIMYTFMFGAVSYDNFTNLFAVLSLYYLFSFLRERLPVYFILFSLFILCGVLTKITFLPYAFILILALAFYERKKLFYLLPTVRKSCGSLSPWLKALSVLCLFLLGAAVNLYGVNKIKYGSLYVSMDKVLPIEACLNNRLFAKSYAVNQFKVGKLSLLEAQRLVLQVRDPGDRANGWNELENAQRDRINKKTTRLGRLQYTLEWGEYVFHRTYSIAAHLFMAKSDKLIYPYYIIFALGVLLFIAKIKVFCGKETAILLVTTIFYLLILSQIVGYNNNYLPSGLVGLALSGRYVFPVLVPLYLLLAKGLMDKMPGWWQLVVGLLVSVVFILGEFPWFMQNVTSAWYF
jgi:hypothetical protein